MNPRLEFFLPARIPKEPDQHVGVEQYLHCFRVLFSTPPGREKLLDIRQYEPVTPERLIDFVANQNVAQCPRHRFRPRTADLPCPLDKLRPSCAMQEPLRYSPLWILPCLTDSRRVE
jgi:hypothetical protein